MNRKKNHYLYTLIFLLKCFIFRYAITRFHNFNERNVYDIITEHQSTEHKYNIETLNEF